MLPSKSGHLPPCHCQPRWKAMVIFRGNCRSSSGHLALWRLGQRSPEVHRPCPLPRAPTASPHPRQLRALTAGRAGRALGLSGLCCPSAHAPCLSPSVGCPRPPHSSAAVPALDVEVATHSRGDAALASPRPRQKPLEGSRCSAAPDA